jgi:hypothetical protein
MINQIQWIFMVCGFILLIPSLVKLRWILTGLSKPNTYFNNKPVVASGIFGLIILVIGICL